jgi:hypothetical protein
MDGCMDIVELFNANCNRNLSTTSYSNCVYVEATYVRVY